jgi:hypothetical protein
MAIVGKGESYGINVVTIGVLGEGKADHGRL